MITSAIVGIIGIISTLLAWFLNPKRVLYAELDSIYKKLEVLYVQRDKALVENDSNTLTIVTSDIIRLSNRKNTIIQRF